MHRAIAAWLTEHSWRPLFASALCGALGGALVQLMLPFTLVACAIPVLTVLRVDTRLGFAAAAIGAGAQCWIVYALSPVVMPGTYPGIALAFFGPILLAVLLRRTGSLNLCFQVAVLTAGLLLVLVQIALPDPIGVWKPVLAQLPALTQLLDSMEPNGLTQADRDAFLTAVARPMWGALAAFELATVFGALLLGRWWDSLLRTELGTFGREYQMLRLGVALGLAVTLLFVLAMLSDTLLIAWLATVALMALTFQGLAAAHRSRAGGRLKLGWLAAIYLLLIVPLSNIVTMFVLASWGFVDNWLRPRRPASL